MATNSFLLIVTAQDKQYTKYFTKILYTNRHRITCRITYIKMYPVFAIFYNHQWHAQLKVLS